MVEQGGLEQPFCALRAGNLNSSLSAHKLLFLWKRVAIILELDRR